MIAESEAEYQRRIAAETIHELQRERDERTRALNDIRLFAAQRQDDAEWEVVHKIALRGLNAR